MNRKELAALVVAALVMLVVGLVWLFGAYALIGSGVALLIPTVFINVKEDRA